jgi:hypothetical protein
VEVDQVASVEEEGSLEVERMGSGAREELARSCGGLHDEVEVGGYTVTDSAVEMPVIRSFAYRGPSATSPGLVTPYEQLLGMMHHTDRPTDVWGHNQQHLVALEQLAYSTWVARRMVFLRGGAATDPEAPYPARVLYGQAVHEPFAAGPFGEAHLPTLVEVEVDQ